MSVPFLIVYILLVDNTIVFEPVLEQTSNSLSIREVIHLWITDLLELVSFLPLYSKQVRHLLTVCLGQMLFSHYKPLKIKYKLLLLIADST